MFHKYNFNLSTMEVKNGKTTVDISSLRDMYGSFPNKVCLTEEEVFLIGETEYHPLADQPGSISKDGKTVTFNQVLKNGDVIYAEGKGIASWFITLTTGFEPVTDLSISGDTQVYVGSSMTLKTTATPSNATNKTVTWKSSDTSIATVDSKGKVTGKKAGKVTITATAKDGFGAQKTRQITVVKPVKVSKVSVSGASSVVTGKSVTLKATVAPSNASNKTVTWKSSNAKIATVNAKGVVKGVKAGTVTITATAKDGSKKKATKKITVTKPVKVSKVSVSGASKVAVGSSVTLKPVVSPSNATNKKVTWKSSNTAVATVDSNGKVTGKKAGTVTITVTTNDGKKKATKKITV